MSVFDTYYTGDIQLHTNVIHDILQACQPGTSIYVDDSERKLESMCIERYLKSKLTKVFYERESRKFGRKFVV
ncbi:hypothetical protein EB118_26505 [bacterium]|nr:hypothetical protein [bacterium]NDD83480.1 hypothetical protein [bacterium]NDG33595.1 hypothetical protein [bacterium]